MYNIPGPLVFNSVEATVAVPCADALLATIFIFCTWKLSRQDVAKPFISVLSLCLFTSAACNIVLLALKVYTRNQDIVDFASNFELVGRHVNIVALTSGGGYYLLETGYAATIGASSAFRWSWFIHVSIVLSALVDGIITTFYSTETKGSTVVQHELQPTIGLFFWLVALAVGYCLSRGGKGEKTDESNGNVKISFSRHVLFFIIPLVLLVITRGMDGCIYMVNLLQGYDRVVYLEQYGYFINNPMVIPVLYQFESLLTVLVVLSALLLHPSLRKVICCSADKTKIAPTDAADPALATGGHSMMMAPMMFGHPQMAMSSPSPYSIMPTYHSMIPTVPMQVHLPMAPVPSPALVPTQLPDPMQPYQYPMTIGAHPFMAQNCLPAPTQNYTTAPLPPLKHCSVVYGRPLYNMA